MGQSGQPLVCYYREVVDHLLPNERFLLGLHPAKVVLSFRARLSKSSFCQLDLRIGCCDPRGVAGHQGGRIRLPGGVRPCLLTLFHHRYIVAQVPGAPFAFHLYKRILHRGERVTGGGDFLLDSVDESRDLRVEVSGRGFAQL